MTVATAGLRLENITAAQLLEWLLWLEARNSNDFAKTDLELTCGCCGYVICDIEPADSLRLLVEAAMGDELDLRHMCPGLAGMLHQARPKGLAYLIHKANMALNSAREALRGMKKGALS